MIEIKCNEPMKNHTTMKVGGMADKYIITDDQQKVIEIFTGNDPVFILGNGSNIIVRDKGIRGIVLKYTGNEVVVDKNIIKAESGIMLPKLSRIAMEHGLSGLEFAKDIPGTLGGAVYMNAGIYGGEMRRIVEWVKAVDKNGDVRIFTEFNFAHRESCFQKNKYLILEIGMQLKSKNIKIIKNKMKKMTLRRKAEQPLNYPSCGTVFKKSRLFIEEADLAGYRIGDAEVSEKNTSFIINKGNATAKDIETLVNHIHRIVKEKLGEDLILEAEFIGEE